LEPRRCRSPSADEELDEEGMVGLSQSFSGD
jgi:hypothetical protein